MAETEKITINLNVVDLGKIDLLVEKGFYSNRTDFIKTATRKQIDNHSTIVDKVITEYENYIGVTYLKNKDLEKAKIKNKKLEIKQIGLLILDENIDKNLALETINSIKIYGALRASNELKKALGNKIKK